ncbi:PREDICTED: sister chromatid cohesion 1 protein 1-like [Camelina sativa]|uniref:Sister chromatid cohesion 1 protein 1-like n=1 Tax=Camelina sativa TaxID=90675 RepID=A0ABM1RE57_CAMSA|nr:PREDICTED: sister chromatid cohesion 1 protein 1-like [Camelina sativa]
MLIRSPISVSFSADAENITLFEYHGSFQTNNETYDRFERFDIEGDDETQMNMNFNPREGTEIPTTLIPSPPRQQEQDIPEGVNPTSPQRQEHGRDEFAEQREEQNIPDREEQDIPKPAKKRTRKTATSEMDYEQTIIAGHVYQSWLQDTSHILCRGEKRKVRGTIRAEMKFFKRANMPPTLLLENHVDSSYPPQLYELWTKSTQRLDESNVNNNPEPEDLGQQFHQADAENITLFEYHGSFQTNNETYDRFERFDIEGDDETQMNMNFNPREGTEIPTTLIPSPPRQQEQDIPEGVNPTSPQRQEHGRDEFAEQREEQNIPDREEQDIPKPAKKRTRKTATSEMDYEQTIIAGHVYQSWLQDTSHILCRGEKRKVRGTIRAEMKFFKRANMPPTLLLENHVDSSYPPQLYELWTKSTQVLKTSSSETRHPDFCAEQSPGFVEERMQNQHQTNHVRRGSIFFPENLVSIRERHSFIYSVTECGCMQHQGSDTSSQNLGSPAERLRTIYTGKGSSVESMMAGSRASPETINRQAADITVTPFYSGDDVRSMPSTPSARGAASINNIEISSKSRRSNLKRPNSSPRRGLEPVAEERPWDHHEYDFEFSIVPEKRFRADSEILFETGCTETQNPACNQSDERITDSIKSHLKTHFETPGAPQVESLNKLAVGMDRNAAAKLFFQSCVLATRGVIKVNQTQPYGDILIARGPNM